MAGNKNNQNPRTLEDLKASKLPTNSTNQHSSNNPDFDNLDFQNNPFNQGISNSQISEFTGNQQDFQARKVEVEAKKESGFSPFIIAVIVLIIGVLAALSWVLVTQISPLKNNSTNSSSSTQTINRSSAISNLVDPELNNDISIAEIVDTEFTGRVSLNVRFVEDLDEEGIIVQDGSGTILISFPVDSNLTRPTETSKQIKIIGNVERKNQGAIIIAESLEIL